MDLSFCAPWFGTPQGNQISTFHTRQDRDSCWFLSLVLSKCCTEFNSGFQALSESSAFQTQGKRCFHECPGVKLPGKEISAQFCDSQLGFCSWSSCSSYTAASLLGTAQKKQIWGQFTDSGTCFCLTSQNVSSEMLSFAAGAQAPSFLRKLLSWVLGRLQGKAFHCPALLSPININ